MKPIDVEAFTSRLSRWPDVEAENLFAHDAADTLALALAEKHAGELHRRGEQPLSGEQIVVVGDRYGALSLPLAADVPGGAALTGIRVWQDLAVSSRALQNNAERLGLSYLLPTRLRQLPQQPSARGTTTQAFESTTAVSAQAELHGAETFGGARLVLAHLPKNLAELEDLALSIRAYADPDVTLIAVGMVKHMTHAMNAVLNKHFTTVTASRAERKARALQVSGPRPAGEDSAGLQSGVVLPAQSHDAGLDVTVCAYGAAFAGPKVDIGTRLLIEALPLIRPVETVMDLGCGTGVLATLMSRQQPQARVLATDVSFAAVLSATATAEANGFSDRVTAFQSDALEGFVGKPPQVILLNPPFHLGHSVHAGAAQRLFEAAARVLPSGGELWTVWNRHLGYISALKRAIGVTDVMKQNTKFVVTRSRKI